MKKFGYVDNDIKNQVKDVRLYSSCNLINSISIETNYNDICKIIDNSNLKLKNIIDDITNLDDKQIIFSGNLILDKINKYKTFATPVWKINYISEFEMY